MSGARDEQGDAAACARAVISQAVSVAFSSLLCGAGPLLTIAMRQPRQVVLGPDETLETRMMQFQVGGF